MKKQILVFFYLIILLFSCVSIVSCGELYQSKEEAEKKY